MKSLKKDDHNLSGNTRVQIKIYEEFYHSIVHIASQWRVSYYDLKYLLIFQKR
jgi:hypothetical protein